MPKATCSSSPKLPLDGNLGMRGCRLDFLRAPPFRIGANWSYYSSDSCHSSESNITKCNARLINTKESTPTIHFGKSISNQIMPKLDCFARLQSRHLNILFWENLGNPDSCQRPRVRHHQSCLDSGTWV